MSDRTRSCCKREDVGAVYHCGDHGYWQRCQHYQDTSASNVCKWYSYGGWSSCLCDEARAEADKLVVITEQKGTGMNEQEEVYGFLAANPAVADVVWSVLQELQGQNPCYTADVIRAAVKVSAAAGELLGRAVSADCHDTPRNRQDMLAAATRAAGECLRFLVEIGNLKSKD